MISGPHCGLSRSAVPMRFSLPHFVRQNSKARTEREEKTEPEIA